MITSFFLFLNTPILYCEANCRDVDSMCNIRQKNYKTVVRIIGFFYELFFLKKLHIVEDNGHRLAAFFRVSIWPILTMCGCCAGWLGREFDNSDGGLDCVEKLNDILAVFHWMRCWTKNNLGYKVLMVFRERR